MINRLKKLELLPNHIKVHIHPSPLSAYKSKVRDQLFQKILAPPLQFFVEHKFNLSLSLSLSC